MKLIDKFNCDHGRHDWLPGWDWGRSAHKRICSRCKYAEVEISVPIDGDATQEMRWVPWTSLDS